MKNRIPPVLLTTTIAAAMWALARILPGQVVALPGRVWLTATLMSTGAVAIVLGLNAFRRSKTTFDPMRPERASALVRSGIYRVTRNPMYLGMLLRLAGWAAWLAHWPAALVGPPLLVVLLNRWQITPEEAALSELFGEEFDDYRRSVRRWL